MSLLEKPRRARHGPGAYLTLALGILPAFGCAPAGPETESGPAASGPLEILIRGHDYAFELDDQVPAGTVRFAFENVGEVPHEAVLVLLKEGVTGDKMAEAMQNDSDPRALIDGIAGILIADPGQTSIGKIVVELEPGRTYALVCNFTDTEDAPPHLALGMMRFFQTS